MTAPATTIEPTFPIWPLPELAGRPPVVLVRDNDRGVDLAYDDCDQRAGTRLRVTNRTGLAPFYLPPFTPVFSVLEGVIRYAGQHRKGRCILIEHDNGWLSYYGNLQHTLVVPTDYLRTPQLTKAGQIIGYAGRVHQHPPRPLRFELWARGASGYAQLDPVRFIHGWRLLPWMPNHAPTPLAA